MVRFDGSVARSLDFGSFPAGSRGHRRATPFPTPLRLWDPDKYKRLEKRRRTAQIKASHALDLLELMDQASGVKRQLAAASSPAERR